MACLNDNANLISPGLASDRKSPRLYRSTLGDETTHPVTELVDKVANCSKLRWHTWGKVKSISHRPGYMPQRLPQQRQRQQRKECLLGPI